MAKGNSSGSQTCPGNMKASAMIAAATGKATRPKAAPIIGAASIADTAAKGVASSKRPKLRSSTPSCAFRSGSTAAKVPQSTPIAANAARGARAAERVLPKAGNMRSMRAG